MPRVPDARLVHQIESKLSPVPCIGPISRWKRHYYFASDYSEVVKALSLGSWDSWFNYNRIGFLYLEAPLFRTGPLDDGSYRQVRGNYDVVSHTASVWRCGPYLPSEPDNPDKPKIVVR